MNSKKRLLELERDGIPKGKAEPRPITQGGRTLGYPRSSGGGGKQKKKRRVWYDEPKEE